MAQLLVGDLDFEGLLQIRDETAQFRRPVCQCVPVMALGKMQDVAVLELSQQLVHFFLPVTGGLPDDQVGKVGVGTLLADGKTVAGLDERAEIFGQMGFGSGDDFIAHAAEAHREKSGRIQDLQRCEGAENTRNTAARFFDAADFQKTVLSCFAETVKLFRQIGNEMLHIIPFLPAVTAFSGPPARRRWHRRNGRPGLRPPVFQAARKGSGSGSQIHRGRRSGRPAPRETGSGWPGQRLS